MRCSQKKEKHKMKLDRFLGIYNERNHKVIALFNFRFKFKRMLSKRKQLEKKIIDLEYRLLHIEMEIVRKSGLWDAKFYIENYHPEMRMHEALHHYMTVGFKNLEKPSRLFDVEKYDNISCDRNPILDFLSRGRYQYSRLFWENKYPVKEELINQYNYLQKQRKSKKVVYTCVTNNYDNIRELAAFTYTDPNWDYICFSDNEEDIRARRIGIWDIKPLVYKELDPVRNNRWHKIHPHILFPDYEESVYIDADINILTSKYFDLVNNTDKDIILPVHADRVDLYKEIIWAEEMGFDSKEVCDKQYQIIKQTNFPENYGMYENNLIYRKHQNPEIKEMMDEWWYFVKNFSQRDQTSLAYIFWKHNRNFEDYCIENTRIDYKNFCIYKHKKRYAI